MSIFNKEKVDFLKQPMFFGEDPNLARYDVQTYPIFEKLTKKQHSFFWTPEEVDISKDIRDFKRLQDHEKFIFTENLSYQILLDSVQGRAPSIAFLPFISLPELEVCVQAWDFFETIHSRSYTYIIRNLYSNPSKFFDKIITNEKILERAQTVTERYDDFIDYGSWYKLLGFGDHVVNGKEININSRELKKKLYLTLASVYILEGIRFYVSFACSFAFAELDIMEGNAKIIELIARDEAQHLAITLNIIKNLKKSTDSEFKDVIQECESQVYKMFEQAVDQEKMWAEHLFKDGSIIGLNAKLLGDYVEYRANNCMANLELKKAYDQKNNPLSWTLPYLGNKKMKKQVAPQETEITSYLVGIIENDVNVDDFSGFEL